MEEKKDGKLTEVKKRQKTKNIVHLALEYLGLVFYLYRMQLLYIIHKLNALSLFPPNHLFFSQHILYEFIIFSFLVGTLYPLIINLFLSNSVFHILDDILLLNISHEKIFF